LPDEVKALSTGVAPKRRLIARDEPARPLYVLGPTSTVHKRRGRLILEVDGEEKASCRLLDVTHVAVFGNATITASAMRECMSSDIPILWFSSGGWFVGYSIAHGGNWVARRLAQMRTADNENQSMLAARRFIEGKVRNQRTLLRRLGDKTANHAVAALAELATQCASANSPASLLGIEGTSARIYFGAFATMLKPSHVGQFDWAGRNRRPPTDPVNALLSFCYALLTKDTTVAAISAGLDPQVGLMHQPRFGRPSLALDLCEEMRPLVADSTVLTLINNGEIRDDHFIRRAGSCALTATGRKHVIKAYERRMAISIRHPVFGYEVSYRRALELQARQLAAVIEGQLEDYKPLVTR
jgi:CRISPR-associated protein Cas1